jgi:DNA-binding transcriptional regulator YhcF (GntR family)
MLINPNKGNKQMLLSTGQLAKELGVHIETIRRWDKEVNNS